MLCYQCVTQLLIELYWLSIKHRIYFEIIITYKALHGTAPKYIRDLITLKQNSSYGSRSKDNYMLKPLAVKTLPTLGTPSLRLCSSLIVERTTSETQEGTQY